MRVAGRRLSQGHREVRRRLGPDATVCFVGDTPDDVRAAQDVGGRVIAVGTGIFKVEDLAAHGPDATVDLLLGAVGTLGGATGVSPVVGTGRLRIYGTFFHKNKAKNKFYRSPPVKPKVLKLQESPLESFLSRIQSGDDAKLARVGGTRCNGGVWRHALRTNRPLSIPASTCANGVPGAPACVASPADPAGSAQSFRARHEAAKGEAAR